MLRFEKISGIGVRGLVGVSWSLFSLLWLAPGIFAKSARKRQTRGARFLQIAITAIAYWLISGQFHSWPLLRLRLIPDAVWADVCGWALLAAGFAFAFWARACLGGNWSSDVTIKKDHTLILTGPYRFTRHPIYLGFLLAILGTAVIFGRLSGFLGLLLAAVAWKIKSLQEERFMLEEFGAAYRAYRSRVKGILPFIW